MTFPFWAPGVVGRPVAVRDLTVSEREDLFEIADRYSARHAHAFQAALDRNKDLVLLYAGDTGHLVGFVALSVVPVNRSGGVETVIYTHWAMFSPAWRGRNLVAWVGAWAFLREKWRAPLRPVYWMFTASTIGSYLVMARNLPHSGPRYDAPLSDDDRARIDQVFAALGTRWDCQAGVVRRFGVSSYREGRAVDTSAADPHVAFFARANPGQSEGDTLACIAPLHRANWWAIGVRAVSRGIRRWVKSGTAQTRATTGIVTD